MTTMETARATLANARAAIEARIMDINAEGRRRVSAGRKDFIEMVKPKRREEEGLRLVFELELLLAQCQDAPEQIQRQIIETIANGLGGLNVPSGHIQH